MEGLYLSIWFITSVPVILCVYKRKGYAISTKGMGWRTKAAVWFKGYEK